MIIFFGIWFLLGFITVAIIEIDSDYKPDGGLDFLYALLIIFLGGIMFVAVLNDIFTKTKSL